MILDNYTKIAWTILAISLFVISEIGFKNFHLSGSNREREVSDLVARGCTNEEISMTLGICKQTVKTHLRNIYSR